MLFPSWLSLSHTQYHHKNEWLLKWRTTQCGHWLEKSQCPIHPHTYPAKIPTAWHQNKDSAEGCSMQCCPGQQIVKHQCWWTSSTPISSRQPFPPRCNLICGSYCPHLDSRDSCPYALCTLHISHTIIRQTGSYTSHTLAELLFCNWVMDFLSNRLQATKLHNISSSPITLSTGSPMAVCWAHFCSPCPQMTAQPYTQGVILWSLQMTQQWSDESVTVMSLAAAGVRRLVQREQPLVVW